MTTPSKRFIPNDTAQPLLKVPSPLTHLITSLTILTAQCPPVHPWKGKWHAGRFAAGLLFGPTSIAYLFLRLHHANPGLEINGKLPAAWCEAYLSLPRPSEPSPRGGVLNEETTYAAVCAAFTGEMAHVDTIAKLITSSLEDSAAKSEWISGHAGNLFVIRLVKQFVPAAAAKLDPLIPLLIERILSTVDETGMWVVHGKHYLGSVHGSAGVLTQVVLTSPSHAEQLEGMLKGLLDLQTEEGNWPSTVESGNLLVHFCHGAPGFVLSLLALRPYFPALRERIDSAIKKGQGLVWKEGLLLKEPCLCHGITGNALCFEDKGRMEHFLAMATPEEVESGEWEASSDKWGLLFGLAGRAWGWMVLAGWGSGMIAYTDV